MINVDEIKKRIIEYVQKNGPSLPIKIAKAIGMEPVFASAILSELTSNQKIKMSKMRVGASQLYLLDGQEEQLESFAEEYFKNIEKRAYTLLKEGKYLVDEEQEPAVRVALRNLKDFATPFRYQEKIMWRYNFTPKDEILQLVSGKAGNKTQETKKEKEQESPKEEERKEDDTIESQLQSEQESQLEESQSESGSKSAPEEQPNLVSETQPSSQAETTQIIQEKTNNTEDKEKKEDIKSKTLFVKPLFESPFNKAREEQKFPKIAKESTPFADEVKSYIERKHITLLEEIEDGRSEFYGIIQINSDLGKVKYLLIARNKKSINDQDIIVAHQKSSEYKMPCYLLHKGKVAKKSIETLEQYSNLIKVQSI